MTTTAIVRHATKLDLPGVLALLSAAKLPADGAAGWIDQFVVAEQDGEIVGSAGLELYADDALLRSVVTAKRLRGTGLGAQLVDAALERARSMRLARVYLLTTSAGGWFPRFGFAPLPRGDVPPAVQASVQFSIETCSSAVAMELAL